MNPDTFNMSIRKFLKMVGVHSQREIEAAVERAMAAGKLKGNETLPAKMTLTVDGVGARRHLRRQDLARVRAPRTGGARHERHFRARVGLLRRRRSRRSPPRRRGPSHARRDLEPVRPLTGAQAFFKCENLQRMGAFKFRGAYNALAQLSATRAGAASSRSPRATTRRRWRSRGACSEFPR